MNKIFAMVLVIFFMISSVYAQDSKYRSLAITHYNHNHYKKSLKYFEKALAADPKGEKSDFLRHAIDVLRDNKAYLNDLEKDETALRKRKGDQGLIESLIKKHILFTEILMRNKFYLAMVEPHLKRAIAFDPKNIQAYQMLGAAYYSAMQYSKAIETYEKSISLWPGNLYAYKMAGDSCVAIGDFDKAKKFYTDMIKANDKTPFKYEAEEVEKVRKTMRVLPETYKDISQLMKEEKFDDAELILKKRLSLNSADYVAMTALGDIYVERGERKNAGRLYKNAVDIAPDYPVAHLMLGRLNFLSRDYENAIRELILFKEKMRLLPKLDQEIKKMYVNDLYYLSHVYFTLKRYEDARLELEEVLRIEPKEQDAYYDLGVYYYVYEHSRSKAYNSFRKAMELDSSSETAKSAQYAIEFIRTNPDARFAPDFSFIDKE